MCRAQKITQLNCPGKDKVEPESTPGCGAYLCGQLTGKTVQILTALKFLNHRMPNGTYGGVRGGCSNNEQPPTQFPLFCCKKQIPEKSFKKMIFFAGK